MTSALSGIVLASLVGSLHCAGMCGGLLVFASGTAARRRGARTTAAPLAWNVGRLVAYAALGVLAGAVGSLVDLAGTLAGLRDLALILAAIFVILWGATALGQALGARLPAMRARVVDRGVGQCPEALGTAGRRRDDQAAATSLIVAATRRFASWPPIARGFVLGLLAACLPCGWLWAFVVMAAGSGSALSGAIVMAAFWLGTLPVMLGLGLGVAAIAPMLRRHAPVVCAIAMILTGVVAIGVRARPMVWHAERAHTTGSVAPATPGRR